MIGIGTPNSQNNTPRPKPMSASIFRCQRMLLTNNVRNHNRFLENEANFEIFSCRLVPRCRNAGARKKKQI